MSEFFAMSARAQPEEPHDARALHQRLVAEAPALRSFLARLAGRGTNRQEVEDLAQEVLARALRYGASFEAERPLGPWLRSVALRAYLDHRERRARAPRALDEGDESGAGGEEPATPLDPGVEQRDALAHLLEPLSSVEREVLVRFHSRGESVREIAAALTLPAGTVKSHLHRARRRLAERLSPEERAAHEEGP